MAFSYARERGDAVDFSISEQQVKAVIAMYRQAREAMLAGNENLPDPPITVIYALLGLAAEGYKPDSTTEAMAFLIGTQQDVDGNFRVIPARPQWSLRASRVRQLASARCSCSVRTLRTASAAWAKAAGPETKAAVRALLAEQRPEGDGANWRRSKATPMPPDRL